jgi:hypothetical protein
MDDTQNDAPGGLESLLAGIEQSDATEEASTAETGANEETQDHDTGADADAGSEQDEADADAEDEDKGEDEPKRKKPSGSERSRRRIERLEAELQELRERRAPAAGDAEAIKSAIEAEIGPEPKEKDFPDYFEFTEARAAWKAARIMVERDVKREAAREQTSQRAKVESLIDDHEDRLADLEKHIPGSKEKIGKANAPVARHVAQLILESEKSALLQLHLAERPEKLAELNRMDAVKGAREIGRLEARLSLPKPRTETKAPTPVRAPKGTATPSSPDTDLDAWLSKTYGKKR